jgi:serine/threonine-protein kinase
MGLVWVADHLTLRTEVVVKFMSEAIASDPVATARFWHEAAAAAAVKSPHVVQMLDHGFTPNGTAFIVMELLDGEDMSHCLARDPVMPLGELSLIVTQACKALTRCHASGVIHRDIKPDNIFLCSTDDPEPFVKLLDFGVAKLQGGAAGDQGQLRMTQTGVVVGTPYYMSPEQAVGSPPVDHTTDLWSLAVVAYEAMTGRRPFDGLTIGALTVAICADPLPVPQLRS